MAQDGVLHGGRAAVVHMHLAKGETERAIRLLDEPFIASAVHANGNLTATEPYADQNTAG